MKTILVSLSLLLSFHGAVACINESIFTPKPKQVAPISAAVHLRNALSIDLADQGKTMEAELRGSKDFNKRSDYAIALMYLGRSKEAVGILATLEQEKPGQYFIAANLGTALELSGDNEKALRWIKEGIRRNPASHGGTEWLHVKILEAKIMHESDPQYFFQNSVLNLRLNREDPTRPASVGGQTMELEKVRQALEYQLGERLKFVKGPDAPVASLLFDYARIEAAGNRLESARDLVKMAMEFGYPAERGHAALKTYASQLFWTRIKGLLPAVGTAFLITGLLGFAFFKWLNRPLYR